MPKGKWNNRLKRELFLVASVLSLLAAPLLSNAAAQTNKDKSFLWVGTWASSPQLADANNLPPLLCFTDCTLRQIVHVSVGGPKIRVRFSNAFGATPLSILSAHVATSTKNGAIDPSTDKALTFNGQPIATIPAGALLYSDSLNFDLSPLSDLAVTIRLEGAPDGITTHSGSRATSYLSAGDTVSAAEWPSAQTVEHWYFLNGVDVMSKPNNKDRPKTIVILGDSITDGRNSTTDGNGRWPDDLARRLQHGKHTVNIGVLNQGIGGNRLLHDGLGPSALVRLDRDVLAQTGVHWLVLFEGVNDIGTCKSDCDQDFNAQQMIAAYEQIIVRAHSHGILVYGATITPFGESSYATADAERARQTINNWIRSNGHFDAVIDFDAATRDSANPHNLSSSVDSRDHLHPSDAGYKIMADSIDLRLFAH
jgi:lysophospholipase L1-like esterase